MLERRLIGLDHGGIRAGGPLGDGTDGLAGNGQAFAVQATGLEQFMEHRRHAAGAVEALAQVLAGRHAVGQQRDVLA